MNYIHFNITYNGRHLFRTDEYLSWEVSVMQEHLLEKFPREGGYAVHRVERPNVSTHTELN